MEKSTILGWLTGICIFFALSMLLPEVRCADGWASPSIGEQGACSHHGGVKGNGIYVLLILGVSIWGGFTVSDKFYNYQYKDETRTDYDSHAHTYSKRNYYQQETSLITSAMKQGRKIKFMYKKPKSINPEIRIIKPLEFKTIAHTYGSGSTLCIMGLCEKRKDERNFALKRMSDLQIL